jgi:hypothetical protein
MQSTSQGVRLGQSEVEHGLRAYELPRTSLAVSQCEGILCRFKFTFEEMEGQEMGLGQISFVLPTVDGAKLLRNFISFYHQAYRAAVWCSRHNIRALGRMEGRW